jgi:hypothetical protein
VNQTIFFVPESRLAPRAAKGKKHEKPFNDVISPVERVVGLLEEMPDTPIKIVGIIRGNSSLPETNQ